MRSRDLSGLRFGRLTVVNFIEKTASGRKRYFCKCDCGNTTIVQDSNLVSGMIKSCGCLQKELRKKIRKTHGQSCTRLYKIWSGIKKRCCNKSSQDYHHYGGRGILMCDSWKNSFVTFKEWAENNGYSNNLTIERIDFNGDYCPDNCVWIPRKEQVNNSRHNHYVTFNGETKTISQWALEYGINRRTITSRLEMGLDFERAITIPVGAIRKRKQ